MLYTGYFGDYFEEGPFGVNVFATLQIKAPGEGDTLVSKGVGGKLENVREEKYVTPSGLEVTIIAQEGTGINGVDGTTFQQPFYTAYFTLNNALFQLETYFNEENADFRLSMLKQVLDAYE